MLGWLACNKAHLLSYLEYHATRKVLQQRGDIQKNFLRQISIDERTSLLEFNLAPLRTRRDIAMLGLVHRTVLGKGPVHFKEIFSQCADMD